MHFDNRVSVLGIGAGGCVSSNLACLVLDMFQLLRMVRVKPVVRAHIFVRVHDVYVYLYA